VSEILNKKRKLTVEMMRSLGKHLAIRADALLAVIPFQQRSTPIRGLTHQAGSNHATLPQLELVRG
jgi:hypothetical protein